jgi:hypothetical protein
MCGAGRMDPVLETLMMDPPYVAGHGQGAPAHGLDLGRHLLAGVDLAAGDHEVRTGGGEGQHHLAAEPAAAARDQRHLAGQRPGSPVPVCHVLLLCPVCRCRM